MASNANGENVNAQEILKTKKKQLEKRWTRATHTVDDPRGNKESTVYCGFVTTTEEPLNVSS